MIETVINAFAMRQQKISFEPKLWPGTRSNPQRHQATVSIASLHHDSTSHGLLQRRRWDGSAKSGQRIIDPAAPVDELPLGLEQEAFGARPSVNAQGQQNNVGNTLMCLALTIKTRHCDFFVSGGSYYR